MRVWAFNLPLCLVAVLALSGCRTFWDPTFMPAGYSYHQNAYKSPPGPEAKNIGYDYNASVNAATLDEFELALRDLLLKAKANDILIPQNVTLKTDMADSAFQGSLDFVLRDILRDNGYTLSPVDQPTTPALFYSAYYDNSPRPVTKQEGPVYVGSAESPEDPKYRQDHKKFMLVLGLMESDKNSSEVTQQVSDEYSLPAYGYKHSGLSYVSVYDRILRDEEYKGLNQ